MENKLREFDSKTLAAPLPDPNILMSLAQDLPAAWNSPSTDMRLKQRTVRILIHEIVADIDESSREMKTASTPPVIITVGLSDCRIVGSSDRRIVGLSDYRIIGSSAFIRFD